MPESLPSMRIDRWLWASRLYKTRSLAAKACEAGRVKIAGQPVKPSRAVRVGDMIEARTGYLNRTVKVVALLQQRIGPKLVRDYLEDLTSPHEFARAREEAMRNKLLYPTGLTRPTKKERQQWQRVFGSPD